MKKMLVVCAMGLMSFAGLSQGWVDFSNDTSSLVYTNALALGGTRGIMAPPPRYYFGLFLAPAGFMDPNLFVFTGLYATNTTPGRFSGGTQVVQAPPLEPGQTYSFQVRGWSESLGHDWGLIESQKENGWAAPGFYGESAIVQAVNPGDPPPQPPLHITFGPFDLMAVPETSVIALAGGFLTLWLGRRRLAN